jgi:hypothetical protein
MKWTMKRLQVSLVVSLHTHPKANSGHHRFALNVRGVENSIHPFSGSGNYPIKKDVIEFGETTVLMG